MCERFACPVRLPERGSVCCAGGADAANTVLLSQMMRELSATPGFTDALLARLDTGGKKGAGADDASRLSRGCVS